MEGSYLAIISFGDNSKLVHCLKYLIIGRSSETNVLKANDLAYSCRQSVDSPNRTPVIKIAQSCKKVCKNISQTATAITLEVSHG